MVEWERLFLEFVFQHNVRIFCLSGFRLVGEVTDGGE